MGGDASAGFGCRPARGGGGKRRFLRVPLDTSWTVPDRPPIGNSPNLDPFQPFPKPYSPMSSLPPPAPSMAEAEVEARDWAEMPSDALAAVFGKLDVAEILTGAGLVCRAWHRLAATDPTLWRRVDMCHQGDLLETEEAEAMARAAVDRAAGTMEAFWADTFVTDDLLRYISRSLRLPRRHLLCLFPTDPSLASPILLDPTAPTAWWPLPLLPCSPQLYGLANFAALSVGRHLYVLGGSCFDARSYPLGHPSSSAAAYRFDLAHSRHYWERLPDMQIPRGSFACAPAPSSGVVIVAGGGSRHPTFPSNGSRTDSTEWYDTTVRTWRGAASMPRHRAGCVGFVAHGAGDSSEDEFWVMGGYDEYTTLGGVVPTDVYCRNAVALGLWSGKWREIGDMWEEGERRQLGRVAALSADDGRITKVFMLDGNDIFRYAFASNRWLREATTRRRIPNTECCGFVSMNGELYVLRSAKVPVEASGPWRQLKKKLALEFQVYNPGTKKWRVLTTHPPVDAPIDFRTAALCTVEL